MIKLAVVTRDEKYLQQLINRLRREKDIIFLSTIIVKHPESEGKQVLDFMKQMIEQQPDIFLLEQAILRDVAALDLGKILDYKNKMPAMKTIIIRRTLQRGKRYGDDAGGGAGVFPIRAG